MCIRDRGYTLRKGWAAITVERHNRVPSRGKSHNCICQYRAKVFIHLKWLKSKKTNDFHEKGKKL